MGHSGQNDQFLTDLSQWAWRYSPFDRHLWRPYVAATFDQEINLPRWRHQYYNAALKLLLCDIEDKESDPERLRSPPPRHLSTSRTRSRSEPFTSLNLTIPSRSFETALLGVAATDFNYSMHLSPPYRPQYSESSDKSSPIMSRSTPSCSDAIHCQRTLGWSRCPKCGDRFHGKEQDKKHNCLRHMKNTHGNREAFGCLYPRCRKICSRLDNFKRHANDQHQWQPVVVDQHCRVIRTNVIDGGQCLICSSSPPVSEAKYASS